MNIWTEKSIQIANQRDYLDRLYKIYPMSRNCKREPDKEMSDDINEYLQNDNNADFLKYLLKQSKFRFPIKDSYVAFLKKDMDAIDRNPKTTRRITSMIKELGLSGILDNMSSPIETNRQIGPLFKDWISKGNLGFDVTTSEFDFMNKKDDLIFVGSDNTMKKIAKNYLGYNHDKGLDFLAKINNTFIIGEAKFLTDFGGHQNGQVADALSTLRTDLKASEFNVTKIAIFDGVIFLNKGSQKMQRELREASNDEVILSSLFLRDYLFTI